MIRKRERKIEYEYVLYCNACDRCIGVVDEHKEINSFLPVGTIRNGNQFICPRCNSERKRNN